jgi:hypothetical protein
MVADDLHPADEDCPDGGADSGERVPGLRSPQHPHHPQVRLPFNPDPQPLNSDSGERVPGLCSPQHPQHPQVRRAIKPRPLSLLTLIVVSVFLAYAPLSIITILRSGCHSTQTHQLQNVELPNVQLQNVQDTKHPGYKTSRIQNVQLPNVQSQNVQDTQRPGPKT